jgi:Cu+-exporting ATPase
MNCDSSSDKGERVVVRLPIEGLHCVSCVLRVESALEDVPNVLSASVDLGDASATVCYRPVAVTLEALFQAIREAGYRVAPGAADGADHDTDRQCDPSRR